MPFNSCPIADQTLDELEGVQWAPPTFDSALVTNIHRLRHLPLKQYRVEDLRLMIGQRIGLDYLVVGPSPPDVLLPITAGHSLAPCDRSALPSANAQATWSAGAA